MRARARRPVIALFRVIALSAAGAMALLAGAGAMVRAMPPPTFVSVPFPYGGEGLGGWSGIDVSPDGSRFWAVSDRGMRTEGRLVRDAAGQIVAIDAQPPQPLPGLRSDRIVEVPDAEGIDVRTSEGEAFVSFEGYDRLRRYDRTWHRAHWVPDLTGSRKLQRNRGLEAVARNGDGDVFTLPERMRGPGGPFPLYRLTPQAPLADSAWDIATQLSNDDGWLAVGADFAPDGMFYLLERRFGVVGFGSRIRRFELTSAGPENVLRGQVVFSSPLGRHGNLEGIGLWVDGAQRVHAVMIADDNENRFQRSEVVEVVLDTLSLASGTPAQ